MPIVPYGELPSQARQEQLGSRQPSSDMPFQPSQPRRALPGERLAARMQQGETPQRARTQGGSGAPEKFFTLEAPEILEVGQEGERAGRKGFSEAAYAETKTAAGRLPDILKGRSEAKGITIDGPASKDLDDAIWLERKPQGYVVHITIADVNSLVSSLSTPELDREALDRSFTRYYADGNNPMIPRPLSEDRLSLLEGQPRPAVTISIPLDAQLTPGEPTITQTYLASNKRFNYEEVDQEINSPQTEHAPMLQESFRVAMGLLQLRRAKGALAIYDINSGWATTEEGIPVRLTEGERHRAQILTQEFMILANESVAGFLANRGVPALYRNHAAKAIAPERFTLLRMIDAALTHPEIANPERMQQTVNLAMERARYGPTVEGHFGLNLPAYVHFTSPIRRYADLVNHRILLAVLNGEPSPYTREELTTIAEHINGEEDKIKDAKVRAFLAQHDKQLRRTVTEATSSTGDERPLKGLDAKQFHSVIRMAAEGHNLPLTVEQEIIRRLEENTLSANDIFTLVFRFQNSGEQWGRMNAEALQWLQRNPHHAISILMMGHQGLEWEQPKYEETAQGPDNQRTFKAKAKVKVRDQEYASAWRTGGQKELAKQLAAAELLSQIAGVEVIAEVEAPKQTPTPARRQVSASSTPPSISESSLSEQPAQHSGNYKGELQELAQTQKWGAISYVEIGRSGPSHDPTFTVEVKITISGKEYAAKGTGSTKAKAEQVAASSLLNVVPQSQAKEPLAVRGTERNAVSVLNEMTQTRTIRGAEYTYQQSGPQNNLSFTCKCTLTTADGRKIEVIGAGKNKKEASQDAAMQALTSYLGVQYGKQN